MGAALSVRVLCVKGRSDCVCRHDVQMVDVRDRNVRNTVLLTILATVIGVPIQVRIALAS